MIPDLIINRNLAVEMDFAKIQAAELFKHLSQNKIFKLEKGATVDAELKQADGTFVDVRLQLCQGKILFAVPTRPEANPENFHTRSIFFTYGYGDKKLLMLAEDTHCVPDSIEISRKTKAGTLQFKFGYSDAASFTGVQNLGSSHKQPFTIVYEHDELFTYLGRSASDFKMNVICFNIKRIEI